MHNAALQFIVTLVVCLLFCSAGWGDIPQPQSFGKTADGQEVDLYTMENDLGMQVAVMTRGATIVRMVVPDRDGEMADVVLGFDNVAGYESEANQFFGCTTGRVANRIAAGKFTMNGVNYTLAINNGPNHLHGGVQRSLDKVVWSVEAFENDEGEGVRFRYVSPHGEEGYPGALSTVVTMLLKRKVNDLVIDYRATTDQETPVNLTNHSYFNLAGAGHSTILDHELQLFAESFTPTDETLIPTGEIESVVNTPLDFRSARVVGERIEALGQTAAQGYDHNFVINGPAGELRPAARLKDPQSGRVLEVHTTQPGVQLYSGNFLQGQTGKGGKVYPRRSALCLETQHFPDSVNHPEFPSTQLNPGETYHHVCVFSFSTD